MTNNEIVEYVYKNYNIHQLIYTMINNSYNDKSIYDLEQYIYLYLLEYDNKKLNLIFNCNKLRNYIAIIIRNQRNSKGHEYWKYKLIVDNIVYFDDMEYIEDEYDHKLDIIIEYVELNAELNNNTKYTKDEINRIFAFSVFKKYMFGQFKQIKLAKNLKLSRPTISNAIKFVKNDINCWYNLYGKYKKINIMK